MKKLCFIYILLFCCLCSFATTGVAINDGGLSYYLSVKQSENGFTLSTPKTFSYSGSGTYLGEIRPNGVFKYLLEPSLSEPSLSSSFSKVNTPAVNPAYTGVGWSLGRFDLAALVPGSLYVDYVHSGLYLASMISNSGFSSVNSYLVNWEDVSSGLCFSGIGGFVSPVFSAFQKVSFKEHYGISGVTGWNANLGPLSCRIRFDSSSSKNPDFRIGCSYFCDGLSLGYEYCIYGKAIYGGTVQQRSAEFKSCFTIGGFSFSWSHKAESDADSGRSESSVFSAGYESEMLTLSGTVGVNRTSMLLSKLSVDLTCLNGNFCINGAKFGMNISLDSGPFSVSVNQDGQYSFGFKLVLK